MILMTGSYNDPNPARRAELRECLRRNAENELIEEIYLFNEEASVPADLESDQLLTLDKIRLIPHGHRLTYRDLFDYSNRHLPGRSIIIANADIFFDHTLEYLRGHNLSGKLLCLSRWDVQPDGSINFFEHAGSQDAWIFTAPICQFRCDFQLGVPACDNRLAWEAHQAGLEVINPARSVRACHLHLSQVRRYREHDRLTGSVKCVPAVTLEILVPSSRGVPPNVPCGSVAFSETMGYTIRRLEAGVSSHNNEDRPFLAVPDVLLGLTFTQVVACSVSPIEVEFLTPGKLYVLVGNDWEGYYPSTIWLNEHGYREDLPLVETRIGTGFEVWSLVGNTGECFVLPTQVMLAANNLVRNNGEQARPPGRHLLISTRPGCGLWSMFFQVIGLIRYAERHNLEPVVYFNDATCWWSNYGYNGSRNAWEYLFEPIGQVSAMELLGTSSTRLEHASLQQIQAALPNDLVMADYILDHVGHYDHTEAQRQEYAAIVERRIRVKSEVLAKLNPSLVEELTKGATAVHYRGTDKFCESPRQPVQTYYDAIQHRVDPSHKLFVATDDASFLEWMIGVYGDRVLYSQAARSRDGSALHLGPQRGPQQAEECLLDVLLMATCRHLVHGNSSVTNGVLVFNPAMSHDELHRRK